MNPNAFSPGEIAILVNLTDILAPYNGAECTVLHRCCMGDGYRIDCASFGRMCVDRTQLRRRPPNPDWNQIAFAKKNRIEELA